MKNKKLIRYLALVTIIAVFLNVGIFVGNAKQVNDPNSDPKQTEANANPTPTPLETETSTSLVTRPIATSTALETPVSSSVPIVLETPTPSAKVKSSE